MTNNISITGNAATATNATQLNGQAASFYTNTINSITTGITGADQITNVVSLTQAEYNAIVTKNATTLYIIVG
jgi:hypothetical protein